jgi:hypothetical protein
MVMNIWVNVFVSSRLQAYRVLTVLLAYYQSGIIPVAFQGIKYYGDKWAFK